MAQTTSNPGFTSNPNLSEIRALEKAYRDCELRLGRPATNDEVCEELGITSEFLLEKLHNNRELNLGKIEDINQSEANESNVSIKYVPFFGESEVSFVYKKSEFCHALREAFNSLPKNEKLIVFFHYQQKQSLPEIAASLGFSESHVAEIHTTAMLRIRPKLLDLQSNTQASSAFFGQGFACLSVPQSVNAA
jgi:RNA polymerase sigma factor for flagellar operon FliA